MTALAGRNLRAPLPSIIPLSSCAASMRVLSERPAPDNGVGRPELVEADALPVLLAGTHASASAHDDSELFRSAVKRLMSPAPALQSAQGVGVRRAPRSAPPKRATASRQSKALSGDDAWAAFEAGVPNGLKVSTEVAAAVVERAGLVVDGPDAAARGASASAPPLSIEPSSSSSAWEHDRTTLLAQIDALRMNLASSAKTNHVLMRELQELQPHASTADVRASDGDAAPHHLAHSAVNLATRMSGSTQHHLTHSAARRRRALEIASAEERRRVELRAARQSASRALKAEQQHAASLQGRMELLSAVHDASLRTLSVALRDAEAHAEAEAAQVEQQLSEVRAKGESELELQEQIFRMQLSAAEDALHAAQLSEASAREDASAREAHLSSELDESRAELRRALMASAAQLRESAWASHSLFSAPAVKSDEVIALERIDERIGEHFKEARLRLSALLGETSVRDPDAEYAGGGERHGAQDAAEHTARPRAAAANDEAAAADGGDVNGEANGGANGSGGVGGASSAPLLCLYRSESSSVGQPMSPLRREGEELTQRLREMKGRFVELVASNLRRSRSVHSMWRSWTSWVRTVEWTRARLAHKEAARHLEERLAVQKSSHESELRSATLRASEEVAEAEARAASHQSRSKELEHKRHRPDCMLMKPASPTNDRQGARARAASAAARRRRAERGARAQVRPRAPRRRRACRGDRAAHAFGGESNPREPTQHHASTAPPLASPLPRAFALRQESQLEMEISRASSLEQQLHSATAGHAEAKGRLVELEREVRAERDRRVELERELRAERDRRDEAESHGRELERQVAMMAHEAEGVRSALEAERERRATALMQVRKLEQHVVAANQPRLRPAPILAVATPTLCLGMRLAALTMRAGA